MASRATFEGWKLGISSPRGQFVIEVYRFDAKKWRARLIPQRQALPLPALKSEKQMQETVAGQFEKCVAPWAEVAG